MTVPVEIIYTLDIVLISRYLFSFQNEKINKKQLIIMFVIQLIGLSIFSLDRNWLGTVLLFTIILPLHYYFERQGFSVNKVRSISIVIYLILIILLNLHKSILAFNPIFFSSIVNSSQYIVLGTSISSKLFNKILLLTFGLSLATFEANYVIRVVLDNFINEISSEGKINYDAGRIIGILERIIVYIFVLQGEFTAIAFIIAAKSLRISKKWTVTDSDYVLIGTFLSAFLALSIALLVSKLKIAAL